MRPYFSLVAICIIWGTTYLAIRVGMREFPAFLFSGLRFVLAGGIICLYYLLKGKSFPKGKDFLHLFISGVSISIGGNLLLCIAEKEIPSGIAAIFNSALPFWIVLFSRIMIPKEKVTLLLLAGMVIAFGGQLLIFQDQLKFIADAAYLTGIIFMLISVMFASFGSVYMKKYTVHTEPVFGGGVQMLSAGIISSVIGFATGENIPFHASADAWISFFYLIIFGSVIAYSCFCYAMSVFPATLVSIYCYVNPVVAIILGYFILQEPITWKVVTAMLITITGVYIIKQGSVGILNKKS